MDSTQSPVARSTARFFCGPKPGQSLVTSRARAQRGSSTVPSVLPESTTMNSSAKSTDLRHLAMLAASFLVMMMTDSFIRDS